MGKDKLIIANKGYKSRLIVGTGKYKNFLECSKSVKLSGAEIVTVAVRRVNILDKSKPILMDYIDPKKITYLPNTAGCFNSKDALRTLRLAREMGGWKTVKLEVLANKRNLFPDMIEIIKSTKVLVEEGFRVLVYCSDDAEIGYPVVRSMSPPDNQFFPWLLGMRNAMEMMLTGETITGKQAAENGFANKSFSADILSKEVEKIASKVAKVPSDIQAINKRSIHRQMEIMGMRDGIRAGTELQALAMHSNSTKEHLKELSSGLKEALDNRDKDFGDYRTKNKT